MSTIKTNTITDVAGSGGPTLTNGATFGTAAFAAPSGSAPIYACRAWVSFNGTGTIAVLGSGNVTSITDIGVGIYGVNFTTAMPDANYAIAGITNNNGTNRMILSPYTTQSTTVCQVDTGISGTVSDSSKVYVSIFR